MGFKVNQMKKYNYSFGAHGDSPSRLQLWDDQGKIIADVRFIDDSSPMPMPTFSNDLSYAKVYFKNSTFPALIDMLRNESPLNVVINDQPPGFVFIGTGREPIGEGEIQRGIEQSIVVCSTCAPDLLQAKTDGILEAMRRLVYFCGADVLPELCPITFHLDGDSYCGRYQSGMTGRFTIDSSGLGHVCL